MWLVYYSVTTPSGHRGACDKLTTTATMIVSI